MNGKAFKETARQMLNDNKIKIERRNAMNIADRNRNTSYENQGTTPVVNASMKDGKLNIFTSFSGKADSRSTTGNISGSGER